MNGAWLGIVGVIFGFVAASAGMSTVVVSMKKTVIFMLCLLVVAFIIGFFGWGINAGAGLTLGSAMTFFMGLGIVWLDQKIA